MTGAVKRVLVSQRCDGVAGRDEVRDGLDVRFAPLLWSLGFVPLPMPNGLPAPRACIDALAPDAIVLTGGNDIGAIPARDATETALLDHAVQTGVPVFALCRGMQFMNHYQGGATVPAVGHVASRHSISGALYPAGRDVNSYHNHAVIADGLGRDLVALATSDDHSIEALCHASLPWLAVMWHPEREPDFDPVDMQLMQHHLSGQTDLIFSLQNGASS